MSGPGPAWRKSSWSKSGNCAEVGNTPGGVAVRDTTDRGGVVLNVTGTAWTAFLGAVRGGAV